MFVTPTTGGGDDYGTHQSGSGTPSTRRLCREEAYPRAVDARILRRVGENDQVASGEE